MRARFQDGLEACEGKVSRWPQSKWVIAVQRKLYFYHLASFDGGSFRFLMSSVSENKKKLEKGVHSKQVMISPQFVSCSEPTQGKVKFTPR